MTHSRRRQDPRAALARGGLLLALGLAGAWGGSELAGAAPLKPLLTPEPSSLAPVDQQAFTQRYGDEALFRLKLGVDAGERTTPTGGGRAACAPSWSGSAQEQAFQRALNQKHWYQAGEVLGAWRRQCGSTAGGHPAGG